MATILCIDDEAKILEIYAAILESKGYRVLSAPDGPTGIAITREYSIDAVVLDFKMRGMDGNQIAQQLMEKQPTIPVVIWSDSPHEIPESLKWFADALLCKGDGPDTLLQALEKIVFTAALKAKKPPAPTSRSTHIGRCSRPPSGGLGGANSRP